MFGSLYHKHSTGYTTQHCSPDDATVRNKSAAVEAYSLERRLKQSIICYSHNEWILTKRARLKQAAGSAQPQDRPSNLL